MDGVRLVYRCLKPDQRFDVQKLYSYHSGNLSEKIVKAF